MAEITATFKREKVRELAGKMTTGEKQMMRVGIIDDNSEALKESIEKSVSCIVDEYSLNKVIKCIDNEVPRLLLLGHDILFWDATLSDKNGNLAISILDSLIQIDPKCADISRVFIGQDIIEYAQKSSDLETRNLIVRAQCLPHIIYGNERGTKIDNMLNYMKEVASRKNIELPVKLPRGICRKEILDKVKPYLDAVPKNLEEQTRFAINIKEDFKDFQPTNEEERRLLESVSTLAFVFAYNNHCISQFLDDMAYLYGANTARQQKAIRNDEKNQKSSEE